MKVPNNLEKYIPEYDPKKFWEKLRRSLKRLGVKAVYSALVLFYALQAPQVTAKDKAIILGALGYFLLPLDLMPDFLPGIGYTDDIAALTYAIYKVLKCITPEVRSQAESQVYKWFKDVDQSDLVL